MPIARMDHFTILTTNAKETVAFYHDILGFTPGPLAASLVPRRMALQRWQGRAACR